MEQGFDTRSCRPCDVTSRSPDRHAPTRALTPPGRQTPEQPKADELVCRPSDRSVCLSVARSALCFVIRRLPDLSPVCPLPPAQLLKARVGVPLRAVVRTPKNERGKQKEASFCTRHLSEAGVRGTPVSHYSSIPGHSAPKENRRL